MIEFTETFPQYVNWGSGYRTGLTQRTIVWWAYFQTFTASVIHGAAWITPGSSTEELLYQFTSSGAPSGNLTITTRWSGSAGTWRTDSAYNTTGQWYHFAVSYDNSSTTNNPIIYVNGTSVAITETSTPSGTYATGSTSQNFGLGGWGGNTIDGYESGLCVYNRILSASEIADAYASRLAIPTWRGLVFAPQLWQRGEVGEGGTLTSSHTIADAVSGALGTPSGSPLHKQDTYLRME